MRDKWGANVVRISLNQDFWLAGSSYAVTIDQQVTWVNQLGMGAILDLHWNNGAQQNMADKNSITFWTSVATRYKSNPWVMFELYNEPHDVTWSVWLNGDSTWSGMQNMYDAIRATGSQHTVIVGGLNWAFDLSGVSSGYAVTGNNIVYATHPYDYPGKQIADWPAAFGSLAATYPVIMTEFGQYCATNTYVADLLNYVEAIGIHWSAWAWYVQGCAFPSVISDWNGTPYPGVGETVQRYMLGNGPVSSAPTTGSTKGPTTAPTSAPLASGSLTIYADGLQSTWQDWSWSTSYTLADTQFVRTGSKSIRFELVSYQGVYLHTTSSFVLSSYSNFVFYVNGGTSAKSAGLASVKIYSTSGTTIGNSVDIPAAPANQWVQVSIPISSFGVSASTQVTGFVFQSNVASTAGTLWIDDIAFVPAAPATTAPTSTTKPTTAPTVAATQAPTTKPTTAPTTPATQAPTTKPTTPATQAPTTKPTTAPTTPATQAPTTKPTTAPTTPATQAPTTKPTSAPATQAPSTQAPTSKPTSAPATQAPTQAAGGCDASSVKLVQTPGGTWQDSGKTVTQYSVEVSHTCAGKKLVAMTITASNWSPINYWNIVVNGNSLYLPSYASITTSSPLSIGYQNAGGQAIFTITSVTFQ